MNTHTHTYIYIYVLTSDTYITFHTHTQSHTQYTELSHNRNRVGQGKLDRSSRENI